MLLHLAVQVYAADAYLLGVDVSLQPQAGLLFLPTTPKRGADFSKKSAPTKKGVLYVTVVI